ncbi:MAG TPA: hypothetical protein ENJ10_08855 [Caldithrix abyssi]|uniref:Solute-binding protein family 5 domain-containing protein n=1 Tax=Caldithrix abyssi TaxID=187145 RepID=A0A7V1PUS0_CALAY|nr:hypothetical protein [Caldithrix abyssi]
MKKGLIIGGGLVLAAAIVLFILKPWKNLDNHIVIPYIAHQQPLIDPHLPSSIPLSDKLDEVLFDGLFNVSATRGGITYEDGLAELVDIRKGNRAYEVVLRLKPRKKWHNSYEIKTNEDGETVIEDKKAVYFTARDLNFTLRRIQRLGSLSPDFLLLSQSMERLEFSGPDDNNEIIFRFKPIRDWSSDDIKEMLSFKILPYDSDVMAREYTDGTGPYMDAGRETEGIHFLKNPAETANVEHVDLKPFIDNSTYTTELNNGNINVLLSTPYGALSPILDDTSDFFVKSNISTTNFALLFNTQRLNREQRKALRALINNKVVMERFFKVGSPQQRHIVDYKGNRDNYDDYLNYSLFPSTSYYVEENIVEPLKDKGTPDLSLLPDSIVIQATLNFGYREEYSDLIEIFNDPALFSGRLRARAVNNEELKKGNYDALLIAISGYRNNFFFNLYNIFLREPDLSLHKINLVTDSDGKGNRSFNTASFAGDNNFFRLDLSAQGDEYNDIYTLLDYVYGFMSTREVSDRHEYARRIDLLDQEMALGSWLFSLPSTAYFSRQFDEKSINLYGHAAQLSTIEKWREKK